MAGRPSKFDQSLADTICVRLSEGDSLRKICESEGMPTKTTVMRWIISKPEFCDQYRIAREIQMDGYFDEQVDIADESTPETAQVARLRIDARKWVMARLLPKKYGDKPADVNVSTILHNHFEITQADLHQLQAERQRFLAS